jgi:hypothetical protein
MLLPCFSVAFSLFLFLFEEKYDLNLSLNFMWLMLTILGISTGQQGLTGWLGNLKGSLSNEPILPLVEEERRMR